MNQDRHIRSVTGRFSAAADTYDVLATAQAAAAQRLVDFIPPHAGTGRILEIGCGTGLLTALLLRNYPGAHIDALDISDRMVLQARARFPDEDRLSWYVSDINHFTTEEPYPLAVSNSSLHWLADLEGGLAHLASLLETGGRLVAAIMLHGTLGELHQARLRVAPRKPPLRRLPREDEVRTCIEQAGLLIQEAEVDGYESCYRTGAAFLRSLHEQGLTGGEVSRSALPLTRGEIGDLIRELERNHLSQTGEVKATYKVFFVHAEKAG